MTIKRITVHGIRLPLKRPFKIAYDTYHDIESLVVRIDTTTGLTGWGEAVVDQHVSGETWQSARTLITQELAPLLLGQPAEAIRCLSSPGQPAYPPQSLRQGRARHRPS